MGERERGKEKEKEKKEEAKEKGGERKNVCVKERKKERMNE